jgi:hypothetical protein
MTMVAAICLIVTIATIVVLPLVRSGRVDAVEDPVDSRERLEREKKIALLAIREADLDRAMGKLSDDDYTTLRGQYQQRAAGALSALEKLEHGHYGDGHVGSAQTNHRAARFCASCGRRYLGDERFCPSCGRRRLDAAST